MFCITQTLIDKKVTVSVNPITKGSSYTYAFYIYVNQKRVETTGYSKKNSYNLDITGLGGSLYFRCYVKNVDSGEIYSFNAEPIKIPREKVMLDKLTLDKSTDVNVVYDDINIPIRFIRKPGAEKLFVLLNGAVRREAQQKYYPYFARISWDERFEGHCLYIYYASLDLKDNYVLGWYRGSTQNPYHDKYVNFIKSILKILKLNNRDLILYGSSGGGFASLKLAESIVGATAVAINPQTDISKYEVEAAVENLNNTFDIDENKAATIIDYSKFTPDGSRMIIVQNLEDTHHYDVHFKPLWSKLSDDEEGLCRMYHNQAVLFEHEAGHEIGEPPEIFNQIQKIIHDNG